MKKTDGRSKAARKAKELAAGLNENFGTSIPEGIKAYQQGLNKETRDLMNRCIQEMIDGGARPVAFIQEPSAQDRQVGGNHYVSQDVQPWDAMEAWMTPEQFCGFLRGNAIKYLARTDKKGGIQDLKKAAHYLEKLIEFAEERV